MVDSKSKLFQSRDIKVTKDRCPKIVQVNVLLEKRHIELTTSFYQFLRTKIENGTKLSCVNIKFTIQLKYIQQILYLLIKNKKCLDINERPHYIKIIYFLFIKWFFYQVF